MSLNTSSVAGRRLFGVGLTLFWLIVWEVVGRLALVADGALPAPSAIAAEMGHNADIYWHHALATLKPASIGFVIGNACAILAALLFLLFPVTERLFHGINITLFAIPPLTLGPILVLICHGDKPQIILAAISVYFPTMIAMLLGLRQADNRTMDLVRTYGGGKLAVLRFVRLRSCLPGLLAGLQVAAPAAILGSILAEFGSGARWGLGTYLLGSLASGDPNRIWAIGLVATLLSAVGYAIFALLAHRVNASTRQVTLAPTPVFEKHPSGRFRWLRELSLSLGALVIPFAVWWAIVAALKLPSIIAKDPFALWNYLVASPRAHFAQEKLADALASSVPYALAGLALGILFALVMALASHYNRFLRNSFLPVALLLQSMPLVALTPILVLLLGRDMALTLTVAVLVTFFPAYVTLMQGLSQIPTAAMDLLSVYGAGTLTKIRRVSIPASMPYLCAAARLAIPRALLGVIIAEWMATGMGLGNLLNQSRGSMDYGMIWAVTFVAVAISILLYQLATLFERRLLRRFTGQG